MSTVTEWPITDLLTYTLTLSAPRLDVRLWDPLPPMVRYVPGSITGTGSLDLSRPFANTAWLTDTESGRAVWATAVVNGFRVYLPLVVRH